MQPSNHARPFSDPNWLFEPKWDGYRAICYYNNGGIRFISRRNNDLTKRFPELQSIKVRATSAIIDGEIVAIDEQGLPCFDDLRRSRRTCAVVFYAFDLLTLNKEDLRPSLIAHQSALTATDASMKSTHYSGICFSTPIRVVIAGIPFV